MANLCNNLLTKCAKKRSLSSAVELKTLYTQIFDGLYVLVARGKSHLLDVCLDVLLVAHGAD